MPQPAIPGTSTAFRVDKYVNDPRAGPSPTPQSFKGPYTADFRATPPGYKGDTPTHGTPGTAHSGPTPPIHDTVRQEQPRRTYYRHDYDKQHKRPAYAHPSSHHVSAPPPSSAAYTHPGHYEAPPEHYRDSIPSHPPQEYHRAPPRAEYHREPPHTSYTYPAPAPPAHHEYRRHEPPSSYPVEPSSPPIPEPPRHRHGSPERRHRTRSHRYEREQYVDSSYPPPPSPPPQSPEPYRRHPEPARTRSPDRPPPARVKAPKPVRAGSQEPAADMRTLRTVTLLIEDRRQSVGDEPVNMLVEVRVPIKEARRAEDGYLADAREVSEALQASPSRLDGEFL